MLLCYNKFAMEKTVTLLILVLSLFLTSATCSRKKETPPGFGLPEILIPDGLGVNIHFRGAPQRDMDLMEAAHIRFVRADLTWALVEHKKGQYDFTRYDQLVDSFAARGGRVLFILDYRNRHYGQGKAIATDEQREGFADFAAAAATRYRGRGIVWEIWNEPNMEKFWGDEPNAGDYMALVKVTCKAIREADRDAIIIAPATISLDRKFITACAEEGLFDLVDAISYHPYREGGPESVLESHRILEEMIENRTARGGARPRIVSSEWGWGLSYMTAEIDGAVDPPLRQAAYLTRRFCTEAYAGVACAIHYKWREDNHGLIKGNYAKKPLYDAFRVLNEQLTGCSSTITRLDLGHPDSTFIFRFEGPAGKKVVAWCAKGKETVAVPFTGKRAQAVDFLGTPLVLNVRDNVLEFTVSEKPIFITMDE